MSEERESLWSIVKSWYEPPVKFVTLVVVFRVVFLHFSHHDLSNVFPLKNVILSTLFFRLTTKQIGVDPWNVDYSV